MICRVLAIYHSSHTCPAQSISSLAQWTLPSRARFRIPVKLVFLVFDSCYRLSDPKILHQEVPFLARVILKLVYKVLNPSF